MKMLKLLLKSTGIALVIIVIWCLVMFSFGMLIVFNSYINPNNIVINAVDNKFTLPTVPIKKRIYL